MNSTFDKVIDLRENNLAKKLLGFFMCDSCSTDPYCDGCSGECGCDDCGSSETLCSSYDYPDQCGSGDDCEVY